MNTYKKYCPNVYVAECEQQHKKGETIIVTTRHGKENEHFVHNFVGYSGTKDAPKYCYSITRLDGFNNQVRSKNRADKRLEWADRSDAKSTQFYEKSEKNSAFLSLGEPIKVGHHSERRHRKMIEDAWNNTRKSIEFSKKAEEHRYKAEFWEEMSKKVDLSMPDSIEFFEGQLEQAKEHHKFLKENPQDRRHSFDLQYACNKVKDLEKKVTIAKKLWGDES